MTVRIGRAALLPLLGLLIFACTASRTDDIVIASRPDGSAPNFGQSDAAVDTGPPIGQCPSTKCPPGHATCEHAQFPCTDLLTDDNNCGACGNVCPQLEGEHNVNLHSSMHCVDGQCKLTCKPDYADCNGFVEDGCEANLFDDTSCGKCGIACPDLHNCSGASFSQKCECKIPDSCGECGRLCPPSTDPPMPEAWNAGYGCQAGECNKPGCLQGFKDCNGDLGVATGNGCEINIEEDPLNCGGCGNKCLVEEGEICEFGRCTCRCGAACSQAALDSDIRNCGACGYRCPEPEFGKDDHATQACNSGVCSFRCAPNWGDCDGNSVNGCETNLANDPSNCGACGVRCNGVEGQACVSGRCNTEECIVQ